MKAFEVYNDVVSRAWHGISCEQGVQRLQPFAKPGSEHGRRYFCSPKTVSVQVDGETKNERIRRLMETAEKEREAFNRRSIGTVSKVLAERNESGYVTGYSDNYTKVYIDEDDFVPVNPFLKIV